MKFYTTKANAKRAAKSNGLDMDKLELIEKDGQFAYIQIENKKAAEPVIETNSEIDLETQQKLADKVANNAVVADPIAGVPSALSHQSIVERPCKEVWWIADEMKAKNPKIKRSEVIKECVARGIAYYTARTQYQQWFSVQKEMAEREAGSK